jgi:hypothetical protein
MTDQDYPITPFRLPSENTIVFSAPPTEEVLRLDKEGFHYRGQFIEDAGEAHRLMVEFLRQSISPVLAEQPVGPTDEELLHVAAISIEPYKSSGIATGEYEPETECAVEVYGSELIAYARAVLARWGQS